VARTGLDQWPLAGLGEIELRDLGQGGDIGQKEPAVLPLNEPPPRTALQRLIGVHEGKPKRIGQILLGEGEPHAAFVDEADIVGADIKIQEVVGAPLFRAPSTET